MPATMSPAEILTEYATLRRAEPGAYADSAAECGTTEDDYLDNCIQNLVAEAVKAGLVERDDENGGYHEGFYRMLARLDALAAAAR